MAKVYDNATDLITFARSSSGTALRRVGYGDEIFGDPSFDGTGDWSLASTSVTMSGGKLSYDAVDNVRGAEQNVNIYAGKVYQVSFEVLSGTARLYLSTSNTSTSLISDLGVDNYGVGVHQINVVANGNYSTIGFTFNKYLGGTACELAYFSMKEVIFDRATDDLVLFNHPDDIPRIEYAADGSLKGLLIEEQRTNLVTHSGDLTDGSWSAIGIPTPTAISDGPYGLPAFEVTGLDTSGDRLDYTTGTAAQDGDTYTYSCWLKGSGTIKITVNSFTGVGGSNEIPITLTDEWVRHSVTHTFSSPTGNVRAHAVITRTTGTAPTVYIAGPQIEEGSFPTSYIPTSGGQKTRDPDIASIPVSAFGYNQEAGTVVVDFATLATFGSRTNDGVFSLRDNSTDVDDFLRVYLPSNDNLNVQVKSNNSSVFGTNIQTDLPEQSETKVAFGFTSGSYAASVDGGAAQSLSTSTTYPVAGEITEMAIGEINGNAFLNGHIKSLSYFPRRLTDAQLQELTA